MSFLRFQSRRRECQDAECRELWGMWGTHHGYIAGETQGECGMPRGKGKTGAGQSLSTCEAHVHRPRTAGQRRRLPFARRLPRTRPRAINLGIAIEPLTFYDTPANHRAAAPPPPATASNPLEACYDLQRCHASGAMLRLLWRSRPPSSARTSTSRPWPSLRLRLLSLSRRRRSPPQPSLRPFPTGASPHPYPHSSATPTQNPQTTVVCAAQLTTRASSSCSCCCSSPVPPACM